MGETKVGLAHTNVLLIHLVGVGRKLRKRYALLRSAERREHARGVRTEEAKSGAAKHVDSFGVGFWSLVRFPAPLPNQQAVNSLDECSTESRVARRWNSLGFFCNSAS